MCTWYMQVHLQLNGRKKQTFMIGLIRIYLTLNVSRKGKNGLHSHISLQCILQNQNHCIEHLHTLINPHNSNNFSTTQVNPFYYRNHPLLLFLLPVVGLNPHHTAFRDQICHLFLLDLSLLILHLVSLLCRILICI